jgi:hypothetical protein
MTASREAIMSALFALVSGPILSSQSPFVTSSRRMRLWGDVPSGEKPALFMREIGDEYKGAERGLPPGVYMGVELYIYIDAGKDQSVDPISVLNPLIDAVEAALKGSPVNGRQTLGGLVFHTWIEGKIMKDPGDLDGDGVAVIPVKILATV